MKISRILLTILPLFLLSGCGISRAEKRELNLTSYKAKDYYEEKYDCDIDITGSSYDYYISVFRTYDTTKMIFTTSEDTIIFFDTELETFYDNRQADEILETFHLELLPKLLDPIPYPYHFVTTNEEVELGEKNFSDYGSHNLFHEYFEKDSYEDFFRKEMPSVKFWEPLYITSETSPDHKKITEDIETAFSEFVDLYNLDIIYLTEEAFPNIPTFDFEGENGFFASYDINYNSTDIVVQNYIKLKEGIYITSSTNGLMFEDGDFLVSDNKNFETAVSIYNSSYHRIYETKTADGLEERYKPKSFSATNGYAFNLKFSEAFKEKNKDNSRTSYKVCVKIVPSEIENNVDYFNYFITREEDYPVFKEFEVNNEEIVLYFYLYTYENSETYFCVGE